MKWPWFVGGGGGVGVGDGDVDGGGGGGDGAALMVLAVLFSDTLRLKGVRCCYRLLPWDGFPRPICLQPTGCLYRTIHIRKALGEMFSDNADLFGTDTLFQLQLWRYRPLKVCPGGSDIQEGVIYRRV